MIVGVGASAGGFEAFKDLLEALPVPNGMAFVFVQHLEPSHETMLPWPSWKNPSTAMPICSTSRPWAM